MRLLSPILLACSFLLSPALTFSQESCSLEKVGPVPNYKRFWYEGNGEGGATVRMVQLILQQEAYIEARLEEYTEEAVSESLGRFNALVSKREEQGCELVEGPVLTNIWSHAHFSCSNGLFSNPYHCHYEKSFPWGIGEDEYGLSEECDVFFKLDPDLPATIKYYVKVRTWGTVECCVDDDSEGSSCSSEEIEDKEEAEVASF